MNREEAIAKGYQVHATDHQMKRRAPWHDYRHPGYYMLTLVVEGRQPLFGRIETTTPTEKTTAIARVVLSPLGEAIANEEIQKISQHYPLVKVEQLCVMPDHLHIIVHVDGWLKEGNIWGR